MIKWRSDLRDFMRYGTRVSLLGRDINIVAGAIFLLPAMSDDSVPPQVAAEP